MRTGSLCNSANRDQLKERIMRLTNGLAAGLTEAYLDGLSLKELEDMYIIAKTLRLRKKA